MAIKVNAKAANRSYNYVIRSEVGVVDPFTVKVRMIPAKDLMALSDKLVVRDAEQVMYMAKDYYTYQIAKLGIIGWDNMIGEDGIQIKPILEVDGVISDASMQLLTEGIIKELADVVLTISKDPSKIQIIFPEDA